MVQELATITCLKSDLPALPLIRESRQIGQERDRAKFNHHLMRGPTRSKNSP